MTSHQQLLQQIDALFAQPLESLDRDQAREAFDALLDALERGELRAARPDGAGDWVVEPAVKRGILLGFRLGQLVEMGDDALQFSDKDTYPVQRLPVHARQIRIVPGGSSVRRGAFIDERVTMMPPAFVNVGAYVGAGTMIDSHALVGSCAQIGKNVHLSAAAQIGGVLEPIGQRPVIIEDDVLVGGNTGIYEGVRVCKRAIIGAGVVITASTPIYDLVREQIYRASADEPLTIPEGAVVVPGAREVVGDFALQHKLSITTPLIVKYRDARTDARAALEEALR